MSGPSERDEIAAVLAAHREDAAYPETCICEISIPDDAPESHFVGHLADLILASDWLAERDRRTAAGALRIVRLVEGDMADSAFLAWRSADARRGLSDHDALLAYADTLTRWSERLRMAFDGKDYRDDRDEADR